MKTVRTISVNAISTLCPRQTGVGPRCSSIAGSVEHGDTHQSELRKLVALALPVKGGVRVLIYSLRVGDDVRRLRRPAGVVLEAARERVGELGIEGEVVAAVRRAVDPVDGVEPLVEREERAGLLASDVEELHGLRWRRASLRTRRTSRPRLPRRSSQEQWTLGKMGNVRERPRERGAYIPPSIDTRIGEVPTNAGAKSVKNASRSDWRYVLEKNWLKSVIMLVYTYCGSKARISTYSKGIAVRGIGCVGNIVQRFEAPGNDQSIAADERAINTDGGGNHVCPWRKLPASQMAAPLNLDQL